MRLSVITVNRNNCPGLRRTIDSVVGQTTPPYEYIVIDGASTDGSASLLDAYRSSISYGVSEQDAGIYQAMNKGVAAAHGDYCLFLNSGDCFCHCEVIGQLNDCGSAADIICGNAMILETPPRRKKAPKEISLHELYSHALCHQCVLIRTELLRTHPYDEALKIVSDRKFFLQSLVLDGCSFEAVDIDIADYDITGYSARNRFESEQEWRKVLREMLPARIEQDYAHSVNGPLAGNSPYEQLFLEIGRRNYRGPVYRMVRGFLLLVSMLVPSARFVRSFPAKENAPEK